MNDKYAPNEILEMAIKIERDGEKFYGYLAKNLENPGKKELFSYLQSQEAQHAKDFERISKDIVDDVDPQLWSDAKPYLESIVNGVIFPSYNEMVSKSKYMNINDIADFALSIEKETIIFYNEILDVSKTEKVRDILRKIIHEELGHVKKLLEIKGEA
ncbi:ferritin-like domain-containing protein [Athalassotoga sp.]|uniref:ferritin-like domain-containing protein n=1 Tax=Athalassotoga sp. TaxID=2022597 RepID=UPI003CFE458B